MVGVPGRSKGCSTCKRRRKKCDLQQPICGNCTRGRFVCGGYHRDVIVVQVDTSGRGQYKPKPPQPEQKLPLLEASVSDVRSSNLNRSVIEIEYFDGFWDIYYAKGALRENPDVLPFAIKDATLWAQWVQSVIPKSDIMRCALLALSVSKVGRKKKNATMVNKGMVLYGTTLVQLAREVRASSKASFPELAATCRMLALYEVDDTMASARNWLQHTEGLSKLIAQYRPGEFARSAYHEMFAEGRYNAVAIAITRRKKTFLSSPEWKLMPWEGRQKNAIDSIVDVLLNLSELLVDSDSLEFTMPKQRHLEHATLLLKKCSDVEECLHLWCTEFVRVLTPLLRDEEMQYLQQDQVPMERTPEVLIQHGVPTLYAMVLCWTSCVILHDIMTVLSRLSSANTSTQPESLSVGKLNSTSYCICISRSVKYFLLPDAGLSAAVSMAFPIHVVARSMASKTTSSIHSNDYERKEEIWNMLKHLPNTPGGSWIAPLLDDMSRVSGLIKVVEEI